MKKRTKQKLKKLLKKVVIWVKWLSVPVLLLCISVYSFINLHNGASIRDVGSHRYAPVLNELLFIVGAVIFLLFALKITIKLKTVYIILVGVALFGLIGWFGYWAFSFTHQDPLEGFLTILIMLGSISLITAIALWYELRVRNRRIESKKAKKKK